MGTRKVIAYGLALFIMSMAAGCAGAAAAGRDGAAYDEASVTDTLNRQFMEWRGVKYRSGGLSKAGVDCSGFVHLTFRKKFGLSIPRTTRDLLGYGRKVSRRALRPGDLVFFRTGLRKRHVGIYMGEDKFIHASTSRGVMVSNMQEKYWVRSYLQSRRIFSF